MTGVRPRVLALALALTALAGRAAPAADAPLDPDPSLRTGTLPNGVRFLILPNATPKGRVSLRLVVRVGSLEEKESERGFAHFIEHLAFDGTTHFPGGTLIEAMQRMGIAYGADANAHTFYDCTTYNLDVPADGETLVGRSMSWRTLREGSRCRRR